MLTPILTHKNHKITTLTITDSYKQLFVLITVLLTILRLQPTLTLTMAAPLLPYRYQHHYRTHQQQMLQHTKLHDILLAERQRYDHNNYIHKNHYDQQQQLQQQLETDLNMNLKMSKANVHDDEERLHKRQINWHDYYNRIMQSQVINWYNPCGGISLRNDIPIKRKRPPPIKKELRKLQSTVAKNYNFIKNTLNTINIQNMNQLEYFENKYTFLPKLNANSSISLRRWHRQLQVYVAAFEYLRRAELHFNNIKTSQESNIALELNELMKDARTILCNIEHAINNTTTRRSFSTIDSLFISRTKMEEILNFTTDIKYVSPLRWNHIKNDMTVKLVNPIDLKFAKSHYYGFARKLLKILRTTTKKPGPLYLGGKANKLQKTQEQQEKQEKQQQQKSSKKHKEEQNQDRKQRQQRRPKQQQQRKHKNSQATKLRQSRKNKLESVLKSKTNLTRY